MGWGCRGQKGGVQCTYGALPPAVLPETLHMGGQIELASLVDHARTFRSPPFQVLFPKLPSEWCWGTSPCCPPCPSGAKMGCCSRHPDGPLGDTWGQNGVNTCCQPPPNPIWVIPTHGGPWGGVRPPPRMVS